MKRSLLNFIVIALLAACASQSLVMSNSASLSLRGPYQKPLIVGHRGACGYVPEHTIRSYKLALALGADYIEPDLVMTKDAVLVVRHENEISMTTDVAQHPEFRGRKTQKTIDGQKLTGWFTEDFTLAELKTLRVVERLPFRSHREDRMYDVVTFEEFLVFVRAQEKIRTQTIGIIPEIKHSTYFHQLGFDPELQLVELLKKYDFDSEKAPVIIQSAEIANLKRLKSMTKVELLQLIDEPDLAPADTVAANTPLHYRDMVNPNGFHAMHEYAQWVSPDKTYIFARDKDGHIATPTEFVAEAHKAGLKVLPWTFRVEPQYLPKNVDAKGEMKMYFEAGVDGIFTDFADVGVFVRRQFWASPAKMLR